METVSPSAGDVGGFQIDRIETPSNLLITVEADGYSTQVTSLTLESGQVLDVSVALASSSPTP